MIKHAMRNYYHQEINNNVPDIINSNCNMIRSVNNGVKRHNKEISSRI